MALHDFRCDTCGILAIDINIPISQSVHRDGPTCCGAKMSWLPQIGSMGLLPESGREIVQVLQPDGTHKAVAVNSMQDIRRLERETEKMYRDGVGQPLRWRAYSQDQSNRDVNSFGPAPNQAPDPEWLKKADIRSASESEVADLSYGPGVSDSNTSPVGE